MFKETKKRSIFKSLSWRVVAVLNSWTVLSLMITKSNFWNAIIMNVSGFIFFYIFERVWNKIKFGRVEE